MKNKEKLERDYLKVYEEKKFPCDIKKWRIIEEFHPLNPNDYRGFNREGMGVCYYRAEVDIGGVAQDNWIIAETQCSNVNDILFAKNRNDNAIKKDIENYCWYIKNHENNIKKLKSLYKERIVWQGVSNV